MIIFSFLLPQVLPASDFKMLFLAFTLLEVVLACSLKVNSWSKVVPRILTYLLKGISVPMMEIRNLPGPRSWVHDDSSVATDLGADSCSCLLLNQLISLSR